MTTLRASMPSATCSAPRLSGRAHLGGKAVVSRASVRRVAAATPLQVQAARTVESKKEVVAGLKEQVDKSLLVAGMQYQGLSVKEIMDFRRALPKDAKFVIAKNTLMQLAVKDTEFAPFAENLKGSNGFLMVGEDGMKDALKACSALQKENAALQKLNPELLTVEFTQGCLDGQVFTPADLKKLEDLPSKQELIAKIAGMIKQMPTKVALAVNALPRKTAYAVKAVKDKMEDEA